MTVVSAHKGSLVVHVRVSGLEAHSGVPQLGVNAIEAAAKVIACFNKIARRLRDDGPHASNFDAPNYTTIQTTTVVGGTAANIVPAHCEFDMDIRYLPGQDPKLLLEEGRTFVERELLPEMRAIAPAAEFSWETPRGCPSFQNDDASHVVELAKQLSGANQTYKVGFGTEAGLFQNAGFPTVVCGPGRIEQAHKPDEYIEAEQLALCERFLRRLLERISQ
jgi:acetylornithine deacetylase